MKNLTFIVVAILFGITSLCAQQNFNTDMAQKAEANLLEMGHILHSDQFSPHSLNKPKGSGKGMRNTGATLTITGLMIAVTGMGLAATDSGGLINSNAIAGLSILPFGVGAIIHGSILWARGNKKYKLHTSGNSVGMTLTF